MSEHSLSEILFQLGEHRENYFGAVSPPLIHSSNFAFKTVADYRNAVANEKDNSIYTRGKNPTTAILCEKIAALEGAEDALVFSSGSAAVAAAVFSCVENGDHVICVKDPYSWTNKLFSQMLSRYGVKLSMVDGSSVANFEKAINEHTRLIYLESPNSLTLNLQDIEAIASLARKNGITTIIDNSYASPLGQSPIKMGVDIVVHSATKYLAGHSDLLAGAVCSSADRIRKMFYSEFMTLGAVLSPHDSWLMLRSLRSLEIRVKRSSESAVKVFQYLKSHPKVETVYYPFDPDSKDYELAKKQMKIPMGMMSFKLKSNSLVQIEAFANSLKSILIACSWGGYESLILPCCVFSGNEQSSLDQNMFRLYVGLEAPEELIADLEQALSNI